MVNSYTINETGKFDRQVIGILFCSVLFCSLCLSFDVLVC